MITDEPPTELARAFPDTPDHMRTLTERLATAAQQAGILDVAYRTLDTPVGTLLLAATDHGIVRVAYACEDHEAVLQTLADRISLRVLNAPARLDTLSSQLDEYFAGRRRTFEVPLDWGLATGFRLNVLRHLEAEVGYGRTATYADLARLAGSPKAVRAVGTACATNPLPVVVPCHRVVRTDGGMGGYLGGTDAKRVLLNLEAAA